MQCLNDILPCRARVVCSRSPVTCPSRRRNKNYDMLWGILILTLDLTKRRIRIKELKDQWRNLSGKDWGWYVRSYCRAAYVVKTDQTQSSFLPQRLNFDDSSHGWLEIRFSWMKLSQSLIIQFLFKLVQNNFILCTSLLTQSQTKSTGKDCIFAVDNNARYITVLH